MFYIVQMADFHFGGLPFGAESETDILRKMTEKILNEIPAGAEVFFCACGDYIDSRPVSDGDSMRDLTEAEAASRYAEAYEALFSTVIEPLRKRYKLEIGLCVGNHDTTHTDAMNQFSKKLMGAETDKTYSLHLDSENVDFVVINSCPPSDYSHGEIEYNELETVLEGLRPDSTKYFVLHHTLMSMDREDQSSIRQVPRLIKLIDEYSIKAIFHGHTHGQYLIRIGTVGCPIIGVGAVFARNYPNVNSQFNLICCNNGIPVLANNYQYHADLAINPDFDGFKEFPISISKENNFFGKTFSRLYDELVEKVQAESRLYHVHLHVKSGFDEFRSDIEENFGNKEELETLDQKYSYTRLAEMWESPELESEVLYFNHGMYFSTEQYPSGIEYILHEIGEKRTSSRAVLVTVNTRDISETASDSILPSLLSIQVGFEQDHTTLHVTMNLRALEVSRFLKINICEVLFIAQQIYSRFPFTDIEVAISAFRVQIKEQFGCFLKAKLDTKAQERNMTARLASILFSDDREKIVSEVQEIIRLIKDKKMRSETVIETVGLENLLESIATVEKMLPDEKKAMRAELNQINTCIKELLSMLNMLKQNRASSSEQTESMDILEEQIQSQYERLIEKFEGLIKICQPRKTGRRFGDIWQRAYKRFSN